MKALNEMESMCSRILAVLEQDDLRSSTVVTLSTMLARLRGDLEGYLTEWRSIEGDSRELRSAQESLRTMNASLLWIQEYAQLKPLVEVSQKLRMASLRGLQIIATLQHTRRAPASAPLQHARQVSSASPDPAAWTRQAPREV